MPKCKKNLKRFDEINVIPFIDIMLVLLVMVLTTATFIKQGIIPVELPVASSAQKEELKKEITIFVDADGSIYYEKDKVTPKELEQRLSNISKTQTVVLKSDKNSKFQNFVTVMDILKSLKHEQLYIATTKSSKKSL